MAPVVAVVPLNALSRAKRRLAPHLDPSARQALTALMCAHVLDTLVAAPPVGPVLLVAGDGAAARMGEGRDVQVIVEPRIGLHAALAVAEAALPPDVSLLVVAADLPLVSVDDISAVCQAGEQSPAVVVAPTHDGGTAALLRAPAPVIAPAFGPGSAAAHLLRARTARATTSRIDRPGFALDVDTPNQLRTAARLRGDLAPWAAAAVESA